MPEFTLTETRRFVVSAASAAEARALYLDKGDDVIERCAASVIGCVYFTAVEDDFEGPCPACAGVGILSAEESTALGHYLGRSVQPSYCPLCEASGELPPFGEGASEEVA
jgi:hypothetical protein